MRFRLLTFFLLLICCGWTAFAAAQGGGRSTSRGSGPSLPASGGLSSPSPIPSFPSGVKTVHAEDEAKVEFKSTTVLVQVPAVVTDKSGNHIHGLTQGDFVVLEGGKEQKIATFEEVVASFSPLPSAPPRGNQFSNFAVGEKQEPRPVTIVLLDTVNTPLLDQSYGRRELLKYLSRNLDSTDVSGLAIITGHGLKVVQRLTGDSARLVEALKKVGNEAPAMTGISADAQAAALTGDVTRFDPASLLNGGDALSVLQDFVSTPEAEIASYQQDRAIETTLQGFLELAWSLSGVPGRKSVVWATGGFPFYLDSASAVPGGYDSLLYERTMYTLNEGQISIYPVDVRGLVSLTPGADVGGSRLTAGARPDAAMRRASNRSWLQYSTIETLRDFAEMTGGKGFYNSNDIAGGFKRAKEDSSSYYLLTYYLDTRNNKPGWRQLKVKLKEKDNNKKAEVRARTGFFVTNATMNPDISKKTELDIAARSSFDSTGLPITVSWLGTANDADKKKVQFGVQVAPSALTLGENNLLNFDCLVTAYGNKDGKAVQRLEKTVRGNISADRVPKFQTQGVGFRNELDLAPGEYIVRFVVRDDVTGRLGSVSAPLSVK
jgi:VWFA-related protein